MKYRSDIDGLRGIAVSSVVLFHAGVPGISGGFVGVDIFFVISGYLITSILAGEISTGQFSVLKFYDRRIRRIFPALFTLLAVSSIVAYLTLLPADLHEFGGSLLSATASVSNIFFWNQSGYFDGPSELKPLLHTWSLAVEEQFYIFFPLLLIVLGRATNSLYGRLVIICLTLFSFALSVWAVHDYPTAAFYWAPPRAWELLLGSAIALNIFPDVVSKSWREVLGVAGVGLIAASIVLIDRATPFPGAAALPACAGAALLIHSQKHGLGFCGRLLSLPPLVFVGLISYSLYLWHWPVFVFARYLNIEPLSPVQIAILIVFSCVLAVLSWRFVEMPFRKGAPGGLRRRVFAAAGMAMACTAACGIAFVAFHGLPGRIPASVLAVTYDKQYRSVMGECHLFFSAKRKAMCVRGAAGQQPSFILVGDSHAGAAADSVFEAAREAGITGYQLTDSGYCPTYTYVKYGEAKKARYMNSALKAALDKSPNIRLVLIVVYWNQSVTQIQYYAPDGSRVSGQVAVFEGIKAMAQHYPDRKFVLMEAPPHSALFGAHVQARELLYSHPIRADITAQQYDEMRGPYEGVLERLAKLPNIEKLAIEPFICSKDVCPAKFPNGTLMYRDDNHLSVAGTKLLVPMFKAYFSRIASVAKATGSGI
jgi:peptidoglycan/LPS O-acetylase OafA/YrhL